MMDTLKIQELAIFAYHGVFEEEKKLGQKFIISLDLELDLRPAAITGDLRLSVHYGELCEQLTQVFTKESYDLIETAGEKIAAFVMENYPMVYAIKVCIEKPWAPVHLPLKTVAIEINRRRHRVFVAYGSNMGNRTLTIEAALKRIEMLPGTSLIKQSKNIETEPWGYTDQPSFMNGVCELSTTLSPHELLKSLQDIETELDRKRELKWGPRTIDLDILFFDDLVMDSENLIIPHPLIEERLFVLEPLEEIAPCFIHPVCRQSIACLSDALKSQL